MKRARGRASICLTSSVPQSQRAVTDYLKSKQLLPIGFARQSGTWSCLSGLGALGRLTLEQLINLKVPERMQPVTSIGKSCNVIRTVYENRYSEK